MHYNIGEAAGHNDTQNSVSDVYISPITAWWKTARVQRKIRTPLRRESTRAGPLQRQKLIYPATAQLEAPCRQTRGCRLRVYSRVTTSLSLAQRSRVWMTMRNIPPEQIRGYEIRVQSVVPVPADIPPARRPGCRCTVVHPARVQARLLNFRSLVMSACRGAPR